MNSLLETSACQDPEVEGEPAAKPAPHRTLEFLLEIGTEEIPALMMPGAMRALEENFAAMLREARLEHGPPQAFGTPRRLILHCDCVAERQTDIAEQIVGPACRVAFDAAGNPTRALEGFLKKNRIGADQVQTVSTPKGKYVAFLKLIPGRPAREVLADLSPRLVLSIPFARSMVWTGDQERFVRPIHYLLALLGSEIVPFRVAGVWSNRYTAGHPILAPEAFPVSSFAEFREKLARQFVEIDPRERRRMISRQLAAAPPRDLHVVCDEELLDEVVHLVEYPRVLPGEFDPRFLDLPQEILATVLKKHQKYFAVADPQGKIQPYFLTVLNTVAPPEKIRQGHQRVLRARLEDAAFYRECDRRKRLEERIPLLEQVLFQEKLGSYGDKVRRLDGLARHLAAETGFDDLDSLRTAARLCKADLTTEMVREFTELQGVAGGLYARDEGYPEAVWRAVYQHYQPLSQEGPIPEARAAQLLALADKADTLCGSFGIGIIPTGSSDPLSLRRQCQGIVRIALEGSLTFSLKRLLATALDLLGKAVQKNREEVIRDLFDFFSARVRHLFAEMGLQYDVINAVLENGCDDLLDLRQRAQAVQAIRTEPDFEAIATSFKRIHNILAGQPEYDGEVQDQLLREPAEQELYRQIIAWQPAIRRSMEQSNYYDALKIMARMRPHLDLFFDKVLVMAEEPGVRRNRLRLLHQISVLFRQVGDLSQIVVP